MNHRLVLFLTSALVVLGGPGPAVSRAMAQPEEPQRVEVSFELSKAGFVPGDQGALAVIMDVQPEWHIYPGVGSGQEIEGYIPTTIDLTLPQGWTKLKTQWPAAQQVLFGPPGAEEQLMAYAGRAIAYVPFQISADAAPGDVEIGVKFGYQACDHSICEFPVTLSNTVSTRIYALDDAHSIPKLNSAQQKVFDDFDLVKAFSGSGPTGETPGSSTSGPSPSAAGESAVSWRDVRMWTVAAIVVIAMFWMIVRTFSVTTKAGWRLAVTVIGLVIGVGWISITRGLTTESEVNWQPYSTELFDAARAADKTVVVEFTAEWCANCQVLEQTVLRDKRVVAALNAPDVQPLRVDFTGENPQGRALLNKLGGGGIPLTAVYVPDSEKPAELRSFYTVGALLGAMSGEASTGPVFDFLGMSIAQEGISLWLILALALIGGFLMNFTPCVLPVIPIKILSLQAHAKNPARCFALGLVFGLGIVAAFAVLGILIAVLHGTAAGLDWGEMFKFWWVNLLLGAFVGVMGLGMLGLFAVKLPQFVYMFNPQSDTTLGSFAMGIFTAILSTPCTGPLVGAMVAWTVADGRSALMGLFTFIVMGIGMAFPYVVLTARPKWLERLPRTGPGSELVKQVLGVLLIAVAVWFIGIGIETINGSSSAAVSSSPVAVG